MSSRSFRTDPERLEQLIEEATVDCYDEEEQHSGLLTMIEDEVVFPFDARVIAAIPALHFVTALSILQDRSLRG